MEALGDQPQVVEILHPSVRNAERDQGFGLLGDHDELRSGTAPL
jgi:hypothetical protein